MKSSLRAAAVLGNDRLRMYREDALTARTLVAKQKRSKKKLAEASWCGLVSWAFAVMFQF